MRTNLVIALFFAPLLMAGVNATARQDAPARPTSIWKGVFTDPQAARGGMAYEIHCARCHGDDLMGRTGGGSLVGERFERDWSEDSLGTLFDFVRTSMPRGAPGSLSEATYVDILAYILQRNGFPSGPQELDARAVNAIRVEGKDGPGPVPNFSLVRVVGCLERDAARVWTVVGASEPVRTRNPAPSEGAELAAAAAVPMGQGTIELMDPYPSPEHLAGRRVEVKGLLIRRLPINRVNVSSVRDVGGGCGK